MQNFEAQIANMSLPPRPDTLFATIKELQRSETGYLDKFNLLLKGFQNDPVLTAMLLQKANSSIFHNRPKCNNVRQAMMLLGTKKCTQLLTQASLQNISNDDNRNLWNHCVRTAHIASYIDEYLGTKLRSNAYLFGLFHDCGMFIMNNLFKEEYDETLSLAKASNRCLDEIELERHGTSYAIVGGLLAKHWNLPDMVCDAIKLHHDDIYKNENIDKKTRDLVAIGHLALCIENSHQDLSCPIIDNETLHLGVSLTEYFGINWNTFDYLFSKTVDIIKKLEEAEITD